MLNSTTTTTSEKETTSIILKIWKFTSRNKLKKKIHCNLFGLKEELEMLNHIGFDSDVPL